MSLKLNSSGGGSVTLQEPTTASNVTLNLPAADGAVVYENASGNVGIGTSSPVEKLSVGGAIRVHTASSAGFTLDAKGGLFDFVPASNLTRVGYVPGTSGVTTGVLAFHAGDGNEKARIDSSGNLLVGTTTRISAEKMAVKTSGDTWCISAQVTTNGNFGLAAINAAGSSVGGVIINASTTSFATSSDYRLKENIQPMQNALARVTALKPCTYKWKVDGSDGQGFIAHELAEVVPDAVTGEKDAVDKDGNPVYQGIDTSFLVATLTAGLQEAVAMIEELKAKVAALEAQ
jgi:hypothetical protein